MFRRTTFTRTLSLIFVLLILAFIWGNSLLPGTESAAVSGGLAALLERIFGPAANFERLHHLLRKAAHMTEYALLALCLSWCLFLWQSPGRDLWALPLLCGLTTACLDETIQLFSQGRGSSLLDVWIDMGGFVLGLLLFRLLSADARRRERTE